MFHVPDAIPQLISFFLLALFLTPCAQHILDSLHNFLVHFRVFIHRKSAHGVGFAQFNSFVFHFGQLHFFVIVVGSDQRWDQNLVTLIRSDHDSSEGENWENADHTLEPIAHESDAGATKINL